MSNDFLLSIWERFLPSAGGTLSSEVAGYFLRLKLSDADRARMEELGIKAQDDSLTPGERAELEAYSHAAAFVTLLQSQARQSLRVSARTTGNGTPAA